MTAQCLRCQRPAPIGRPVDLCAVCRHEADRFHAIFTKGRGESVGESWAAGLVASGLALFVAGAFLTLVKTGALAELVLR